MSRSPTRILTPLRTSTRSSASAASRLWNSATPSAPVPCSTSGRGSQNEPISRSWYHYQQLGHQGTHDVLTGLFAQHLVFAVAPGNAPPTFPAYHEGTARRRWRGQSALPQKNTGENPARLGGARYSVTDSLDVVGAYYHYWENTFAAPVIDRIAIGSIALNQSQSSRLKL